MKASEIQNEKVNVEETESFIFRLKENQVISQKQDVSRAVVITGTQALAS